ncbi:MAG: FAD-dependent oxidoreductase [Thermoprotei archaeon]
MSSAQSFREFRLPFARIIDRAPTIKSFVFDTRGLGFSFTAGQYLKMTLEDVVGDPRGNSRDFSISSPSTEASEQISVTTTVEPEDSPFKKKLAGLRPGDVAKVKAPFGRFVLDHAPGRNEPIVMVAGGIGITPFRSIILTELAENAGDSRPLTLLYSAKTPENLVFKEEFDRLSSIHRRLKVHYTVTRAVSKDPGIENGRVDSDFISKNTEPSHSVYYLAGPPSMVQELSEQIIQKLSVPRERIKTEKFTGY